MLVPPLPPYTVGRATHRDTPSVKMTGGAVVSWRWMIGFDVQSVWKWAENADVSRADDVVSSVKAESYDEKA